MKKFSVIIPSSRGRQSLIQTVSSLIAQHYPHTLFEIIIVANGNKEIVAEVVRHFKSRTKHQIKFVSEARRGPSFARNKGINESRYDWLAFTDDDCVVARDWLQNFDQFLRSHAEVRIAGGKVLAQWVGDKRDQRDQQYLSTELHRHWWLLGHTRLGGRERRLHFPEHFFSANLVFHKSLGLFFNERLGRVTPWGIIFGEDVFLCTQAFHKGFQLWYLPHVVVKNHITKLDVQSRVSWRRHFEMGQEMSILHTELLKIGFLNSEFSWQAQVSPSYMCCHRHGATLTGFAWRELSDL